MPNMPNMPRYPARKKFLHILYAACFWLIILAPEPARAADIACPQMITSNDTRDHVGIAVFERVSAAYRKLGCNTEFVPMPLKRALHEFNQSRIDGELIRTQAIEQHYKIPFIRSSVPVYQAVFSVWLHPDVTVRTAKPVGFHGGYVVLKKHPATKDMISMANLDHLYAAYKLNKISGFIENDRSVQIRIEKNQFDPAPVKAQEVLRLNAWHYLKPDHADFMKALDQVLADQAARS